jgi:RNA polymerase sigma factor (TIGR02999 family)
VKSVPGVTQLLENWQSGDADAFRQLTPLVYEELRGLARRYMQMERPGHTLQATGLVNEALLRLADVDQPWADRTHFLAIAARLMRRILIDHARAHDSAKRGSGQSNVTLQEDQVSSNVHLCDDILELDDVLTQLAIFDERKSDVVVMHFFGGMTYDETAEALGISTATVHRELRLAKAWLLNELRNG